MKRLFIALFTLVLALLSCPPAQATRDASRAALASGMVDFDSVIEAERQLIDIRARRLQTELEARLALAEIRKLTGEFK